MTYLLIKAIHVELPAELGFDGTLTELPIGKELLTPLTRDSSEMFNLSMNAFGLEVVVGISQDVDRGVVASSVMVRLPGSAITYQVNARIDWRIFGIDTDPTTSTNTLLEPTAYEILRI